MSATSPVFGDDDTNHRHPVLPREISHGDPIRFRRLSGEIMIGSAWHMAVEFAAPCFTGRDAA